MQIMALIEIAGFYVAAAAAFYEYVIKTAANEELTPIVRRMRWHRARGKAAGSARRAL